MSLFLFPRKCHFLFLSFPFPFSPLFFLAEEGGPRPPWIPAWSNVQLQSLVLKVELLVFGYQLVILETDRINTKKKQLLFKTRTCPKTSITWKEKKNLLEFITWNAWSEPTECNLLVPCLTKKKKKKKRTLASALIGMNTVIKKWQELDISL